ncbi:MULTISPECIES: RNA 3'-terminal phosphate cyclase [Halorussus]|uniref:RNA 3'-terminal phosphate cyclase n=1 Tax=Halorussus TaxID=1070314 RepID=UPI00209ECACE|nr:RNA 3'-terminal phosphate cyclase [Halorussus vallis]USZ78083.1 RNA 3'-terminal phosphate cyclase [Halorussus vallis]
MDDGETESLLELDGSAGGGQLVRTALTLSAATNTPFRMIGIRGARPNPGLRHQHLAAVRAVASVCGATVDGAELGSETLTFRPDRLAGGRHEIEVGTAGSVSLVFDAVVPLALALDAPVGLTARGGTDVKWSPPMPYYRRVKLPLLRQWGLHAAVDLAETGYYPAGGGEATLWLAPSSPPPLELTERGSLDGARVHAKASADLADRGVADRLADAAVERLEAESSSELSVGERTTAAVETASPGAGVTVALDFAETTAGFDALGERGRPAAAVGREAADAALAFLDETEAAVDAHLADQLVVLLALAGGLATIPRVTDHVETSLDLVAAFDRPVTLDDGDPSRLRRER